MAIGSITIDLLAKTQSFETDMARASKTAAKRAKEIDDAVSKAGVAIGAAFAAAGTAAIYFGKQTIDGLDALNDVRDATGSTIENISALEDVALRTGTSFDTVQGALVKFNNTLKEADGKNGASQALKAIGLDAEKLKAIDPAEALRQTAAALATFADDGDKARLVQELFGKSVREVAPFLKDLAEKTELVGTVTTAQAQAAEDFNKQLFALQKGATDLGRTLISDLLPSITRTIEEFSLGRKMAGSFLDAILTFGTINPFKTQEKNLKGLREEIDGLEKDRARYVNSKSDTRGIDDAIRNSKKQYEYLKTLQARDALAGAGDTGDAVSRRFMRPAAALPSVGPLASGGGAKTPKTAAARESELQRYIENLGKQLDQTKQLTTAEQVLADVQSGRLKLQKGETIDRAVAMAKEVDAAKAMVEYRKLAADAEKERDAALLKSAETQEEQAKSLIEGNKAMREETELLGKSVEAQAAIEKARISSKVAILEENLARSESSGALVRETDAIRSQIDALTERKDLLGERAVAQRLKEDADEAKAFASQVGAAFESSFEKAILEGGKLSDVIGGLIKDIAQLVIRQQITGPIAKAIGGASSGGSSGGGFADLLAGVGKWFSGLAFADGGSPPVGKASLVGERGPELFVPRTAGTIIPNHAMGGGQKVSVTINNTVGNIASIDDLQKSQRGTERRIAAMIARSQNYGGQLAS